MFDDNTSSYDPSRPDTGLLGARVVLVAGCLCFGLLTTLPAGFAFGQEVQVVRPQTDGPVSKSGPGDKPAHSAKNGQTEAAVAIPEELVGEPVMSLEGETLGDVAQVQVNDNGLLVSLDAELGGFFGIGAKLIRFSAEDFAVNSHGVVLDMTSNEVSGLLD